MYNGIGVPTPRGTGTNGFVQRNFAALPAWKIRRPVSAGPSGGAQKEKEKPNQKEPNKEILEHDRKRQIEIKLLQWAEKKGLLDSGLPQEEIDMKMAKQRLRIEKDEIKKQRALLEQNDSHVRAQLKLQKTKAMARALKVDDKYEEGAAFDQDKQEQKKQERLAARLKQEEERLMKEREKLKKEKEEKKKLKKVEQSSSSDSSDDSSSSESSDQKKKKEKKKKKKLRKSQRKKIDLIQKRMV
eukprot:TRINITY_DN2224_c0_g1_i6.p2 TRINITY_DN2224_c0_g1~~TRINITY_DN2224_c0_g1_i6.p2  ORF type:complete len:249 (+),score=72.99 TRINITY_DN2224_c0_g1_i6:22-747(+)